MGIYYIAYLVYGVKVDIEELSYMWEFLHNDVEVEVPDLEREGLTFTSLNPMGVSQFAIFGKEISNALAYEDPQFLQLFEEIDAKSARSTIQHYLHDLDTQIVPQLDMRDSEKEQWERFKKQCYEECGLILFCAPS